MWEYNQGHAASSTLHMTRHYCHIGHLKTHLPHFLTLAPRTSFPYAGSQWERANEVFDQMGAHNCQPDVVTYTALISALERGGQWQRALGVYHRMCAQGCKPDAIVYNGEWRLERVVGGRLRRYKSLGTVGAVGMVAAVRVVAAVGVVEAVPESPGTAFH